MKLARTLWIGTIFGATALSAIVGAVASRKKHRAWYRTLRKSELNPPDEVFGPVWTLLYGLSALSATRLYLAAPSAARSASLSLWTVQQLLNAAWSPLFFGKRKARMALVDVGALWLTLAALARNAHRADKAAGVLLVPYLAWVTFAAYLNYAVVQKNPRWLTS